MLRSFHAEHYRLLGRQKTFSLLDISLIIFFLRLCMLRRRRISAQKEKTFKIEEVEEVFFFAGPQFKDPIAS